VRVALKDSHRTQRVSRPVVPSPALAGDVTVGPAGVASPSMDRFVLRRSVMSRVVKFYGLWFTKRRVPRFTCASSKVYGL